MRGKREGGKTMIDQSREHRKFLKEFSNWRAIFLFSSHMTSSGLIGSSRPAEVHLPVLNRTKVIKRERAWWQTE